MIITRSPLRISLAGGSLDLPVVFHEQRSFVISAAIDKYVYVCVNRPFTEKISLKYSKLEDVQKIDCVEHNIIRETLRLLNLNTPQIEITTLADAPSSVGLGGSSSFTTALLKALYTHYKMSIDTKTLAELACKIEIDILQQPIGKQDQYIASYGGITKFWFNTDNTVDVLPLRITHDNLQRLQNNMLLFYTGITHNTNDLLKDQNDKVKSKDKPMLDNLESIRELAIECEPYILNGDIENLGKLFHRHWQVKRKRTEGMTNSKIDGLYNYGLNNGAIGGKVVGSGGGGLIIFCSLVPDQLCNAMKQIGIEATKFKFDFEGTKVI